MTSTEPTKPKRSVRERGWSQKLWDAYAEVGESDSEYVKSANRFLGAMVHYRLPETMELVRHLALHLVLKGKVPNPERYKSHTSGIASLLVPEVSKAKTELDIYRRWWTKYVQWEKAQRCVCKRDPVRLDRLEGLLNPKVGERTRIWRMQPMFLEACVQVARRSLEEDGFTDLEVFTSHGELGSNDPIPADATLWITINRRMEAYLDSGQWRIDDRTMEDLTDLGAPFDVPRYPKESRTDYINRVKDLVDDRLILAMQKADELAWHPKVKLHGRSGPPLNTRFRHEDMLVRRLFGVGNPARPVERQEIVDAMPDAFLKEDGKPVQYPKDAVSERTNRIGKYLGFLAAGGKTP